MKDSMGLQIYRNNQPIPILELKVGCHLIYNGNNYMVMMVGDNHHNLDTFRIDYILPLDMGLHFFGFISIDNRYRNLYNANYILNNHVDILRQSSSNNDIRIKTIVDVMLGKVDISEYERVKICKP